MLTTFDKPEIQSRQNANHAYTNIKNLTIKYIVILGKFFTCIKNGLRWTIPSYKLINSQAKSKNSCQ